MNMRFVASDCVDVVNTLSNHQIGRRNIASAGQRPAHSRISPDFRGLPVRHTIHVT